MSPSSRRTLRSSRSNRSPAPSRTQPTRTSIRGPKASAIDEETLKAVADATGGTYYPAESANELQTVFQNLPTDLITKHEVMEISVAFAALGVLLVALAILLGQAWRPLP